MATYNAKIIGSMCVGKRNNVFAGNLWSSQMATLEVVEFSTLVSSMMLSAGSLVNPVTQIRSGIIIPAIMSTPDQSGITVVSNIKTPRKYPLEIPWTTANK